MGYKKRCVIMLSLLITCIVCMLLTLSYSDKALTATTGSEGENDCNHYRAARQNSKNCSFTSRGFDYIEPAVTCPKCGEVTLYYKTLHFRSFDECSKCGWIDSFTCNEGCSDVKKCKCYRSKSDDGSGSGGGGGDKTTSRSLYQQTTDNETETESEGSGTPPDPGSDSRLTDGDVPLFLEVGDPSGSHSEMWRLHVGDATLTSAVGECEVSEIYWFTAGQVYNCSLEHLYSKLDEPDLDYLAFVREADLYENEDGEIVVNEEPGARAYSSDWYGGYHFVIENSAELFGGYGNADDYASRSATLYVPKLTITADEESKVVAEDGTTTINLTVELLLASRLKNDGLSADDALLELVTSNNVILKDTSGNTICAENSSSSSLWENIGSDDKLQVVAEFPCGETFSVNGYFYVDYILVNEDYYSSPLDMDVDSDNTNYLSTPDESGEEDTIEDSEDEVGKLIPVNDGDLDEDDLPDYVDSEVSGVPLIPLRLKLLNVDSEKSRIRFEYDFSDPDAVTDSVDDEGNYIYELPEEGKFRILMTNDTEHSYSLVDDGGELIKSGTTYTTSDLGFDEGTVDETLYIEAVKPGKGTITVYYNPDITDDESEELVDVVNIRGIKTDFIIPGDGYDNGENPNVDPVEIGSDVLPISIVKPFIVIESNSATTGSDSVEIEFSGYLRDLIADNVPRESGADIDEITITVDGEDAGSVVLGDVTDEEKGFWQQHYYKQSFSGTASVPLVAGAHTITLATSENLAGNIGYASISINIENQNDSCAFDGDSSDYDGTVYHNIYFEQDLSETVADSCVFYSGNRDPDLDDPDDEEDTYDLVLSETDDSDGCKSLIFTEDVDDYVVQLTIVKLNGNDVSDEGNIEFDDTEIETITVNIEYLLDGEIVEQYCDQVFTETSIDSHIFRTTLESE